MYEMETVVADVRGVSLSVCLSVCLSRGSSRLHCARTAEPIKMLFGMNTPGDPWNIVLDVGPDPPQRGEGGPLLNFGSLLIFPEQPKLETWHFLCIQKDGEPHENYATVGHMRVRIWVP